MPELPEVETIKRSLEQKIIGRKILKTQVFLNRIITLPQVDEFKRNIAGKSIENIKRRGKYLLLHLSDGYVLVIHLRMTGQLLYVADSEQKAKHTHVVFDLDNNFQLRYVDIRQFGTIYLLPMAELKKIKGLAELGPEPLSEDFTKEYLKGKLTKKTKKIKQVLLDQNIIAGLGNIYTDEILFAAKINPYRCAGSLNDEEIEKLHYNTKGIIKKAIDQRGTSFRDYIDADGKKGTYQDSLKVYQKTGRLCTCCGRPIKREKLAGRSTHFCTFCQK